MEATTIDELKLVEARPEHIPFIAWVMLTAARSHLERGMWDLMAGPDEGPTLRFLEALASAPEPNWAHHSMFLVAEVRGRPVSALGGYFDEEHGPASLETAIPAAAIASGMDLMELAMNWQTNGVGTIKKVAPEHDPGAWIVEHVATLPEFRRQGLIDRLLAAVIEKGRSRGAKVADVGVFIGNDRAQHAYEKAGFVVTGERCNTDFEAAYGFPGVRDLSRTI
ncbi:MAG: GNAT family N-acetyltransferase [Deltaproteobacteria bacterium]|nr:GNAT family N-acetyltransferase [Deltaproteobacteria bacterium]